MQFKVIKSPSITGTVSVELTAEELAWLMALTGCQPANYKPNQSVHRKLYNLAPWKEKWKVDNLIQKEFDIKGAKPADITKITKIIQDNL